MERPNILIFQVLVGSWRYVHPATEGWAFKRFSVSYHLWQQRHKGSPSWFFQVWEIPIWLHLLWAYTINEFGSLERGEEPRWAWETVELVLILIMEKSYTLFWILVFFFYYTLTWQKLLSLNSRLRTVWCSRRNKEWGFYFVLYIWQIGRSVLLLPWFQVKGCHSNSLWGKSMEWSTPTMYRYMKDFFQNICL